MTSKDWFSYFPGLSQLEASVRDILVQRSKIITVPEGVMLFGPGKVPENLLLLIEGCIRVQKISEAGREIVLYRVESGQSCVLTTAFLLAYDGYSAEGIVETEVRAVAIPREVFDDLIVQSATFRTFILTAYSKRIADLFQIIEDIAFQRVDIRLAQKLIDLERGTGQVKVTHQQLAAELGTAREVISRQLGEFQRRAWIRQSRGSIDLVSMTGLQSLAALNV